MVELIVTVHLRENKHIALLHLERLLLKRNLHGLARPG
jgi:hypothetical protein